MPYDSRYTRLNIYVLKKVFLSQIPDFSQTTQLVCFSKMCNLQSKKNCQKCEMFPADYIKRNFDSPVEFGIQAREQQHV